MIIITFVWGFDDKLLCTAYSITLVLNRFKIGLCIGDKELRLYCTWQKDNFIFTLLVISALGNLKKNVKEIKSFFFSKFQ